MRRSLLSRPVRHDEREELRSVDAINPTQTRVEQKVTLPLQLDHGVHVKQYAEFFQSPKNYVIGQALRRLFRNDKEFAARSSPS